MKIYDASNNLLLDVEVDDSSYRYRAIMGDHNLTLYFSLPEHVELPYGAWCEFQNQKYYLMRPGSLKMKHSRYFEYTVVMESIEWQASNWIFRCIYTDEKKSELSDGRVEFTLTATAEEFLQMVVDNLNYRDSGWDVGQCVNGTKTISFNHNTIIDALKSIADNFDTEYEISSGKTVSLHKLSYYKSVPLSLSYGKGNGIKPNVKRSNSSDTMPIERLWVQGGEQNIDRSKYGSKRLHLPKGGAIGYDGEHFEDEVGYSSANARRYIADSNGESITRADKTMSTYAEGSLDCTDIYPKRVGTISQVVVRDEKKHWYDVYDDEIPDELDYNEYTIGDEQMTIIFQDGMLAGKEFDIDKYNHGNTQERYFEVTPQEIDGETMPGGVFVPEVGKAYAIFGCSLPDSYISNAEWEMMKEAVKYMFEHEDEKYTISASLDGIWAKRDWENIGGRIRLGSYIKFSDEQFCPDGVLVRITGIKDYINKPHSPEIELSDEAVSVGLSGTIKELEATPAIIEETYKKATRYTKRSFFDAQDTIEALKALVEAGFGHFTGGITPISVQTMQLVVGDESLQYRFVTSATAPVQTEDSVEYSATTKQLTSSPSIIQHMTLGVTNLSSSHKVSEYKFWYIKQYVSAILDDGTKRYYIYIKASKTDENDAEFILSEKVYKMDGSDNAVSTTEAANDATDTSTTTESTEGTEETKTVVVTEDADPNYYYFLFGILNTEYEGDRSIAKLYGFTEVLPGRVTTDKIVSTDGLTYFDLVQGIIGGNIKFRSTGGGEKDITELEKETEAATETLNTWASDKQISPTEKTSLKAMRSQIEADYLEVVDRCEKYKVSSTAFGEAYTMAIVALGKYTQDSPENITIEDDYANIAAYWTAKKTVLLAVNAAISNEYTEIRDDVDDAKSDAANAAAEAQAAQTELNDWASDKNVSPAEKKSLSQMMTQIKKDYEEIVDRCGKYGVNYDSFTTAYTAAIDSLDYYTQNPETTTALSDEHPYSNIANYWTARTTQLLIINTKLNSYTDALVNTAVDTLSQAISDGDKETYDDALKRIMILDETTIEGGWIKTSLINTKLLEVRKIIAGDEDEDGMVTGQRVEIDPKTKQIVIYDSSNNVVQVLEGNSYTDIAKLFASAYGSPSITSSSGSFEPCKAPPGYNTSNSASYEAAITDSWYTDSPARVTLGSGAPYLSVQAGTQGTTAHVMVSNATAFIYLRVRTYSDSSLTDLIEEAELARASVGTSYDINKNKVITASPSWAGKSTNVKAGYHKAYIIASLSAYVGGSDAHVSWSGLADLEYDSDFYVSRFFANGFCLGTSANDYLFAFKQSSGGMRFIGLSGGYNFDFSSSGITMKNSLFSLALSSSGVKAESDGYGVEIQSDGIKMKHHSSGWRSLPVFVAKFKVAISSAGVLSYSGTYWNGIAPTFSKVSGTTGTILVTVPSSWSALGLTEDNIMMQSMGLVNSSGNVYTNPVVKNITTSSGKIASFTIVLTEGTATKNDTAAYFTIYKI